MTQSFKRLPGTRHASHVRKQCKGPATVAAHAPGTPVGVVVLHQKISPITPFEYQKPIGPDSEMTITERWCQLAGINCDPSLPVVDYDEIIPQPRSLREIDLVDRLHFIYRFYLSN
jgi:hypothetical protein